MIKDIKKNISGMSSKSAIEYIITYYWYHMLGICAFVGLVVFLIAHFCFPKDQSIFTCAIFGTYLDDGSMSEVARDFANECGVDESLIVFDVNYRLGENADDVQNEYALEKLILQWSVGSVDAVILDRDVLASIVNAGGEFTAVPTIDINQTSLAEYFADEKRDFYLVFPSTGRNPDTCQKFAKYISR